MAQSSRRSFLATLALGATACTPSRRGATRSPTSNAAQPRAVPGLAIHGGAGAIDSKSMGADKTRNYEASLKAALMHGHNAVAQGKVALDVVEEVIRILEDNPLFNAGKGAVLTADKRHELDASIMCGRTLRCGAVAGVTTVRHPITLARKVMDQTRHVLLSGPGADRFAEEMGVERVSQEYFLAPGRLEAFERAKQRHEQGRAAEDGEKKRYGRGGRARQTRRPCSRHLDRRAHLQKARPDRRFTHCGRRYLCGQPQLCGILYRDRRGVYSPRDRPRAERPNEARGRESGERGELRHS